MVVDPVHTKFLKVVQVQLDDAFQMDFDDLRKIWLVNPMSGEGFTQERLDAVNTSQANEYDPLIGCSLRESIRRGYHCENDEEADYLLRRFIAS